MSIPANLLSNPSSPISVKEEGNLLTMSPGKPYRHLLFFLLSLLSLANSDDLQLLLTIKTSLHNSNPKFFESWDSNNSFCNFTGITCNPESLIKEIQLSNQKLSGTFPFDSVCQIQSLEMLSLGQNFLYGPVTDGLNNCSRLTYLDIGNNRFSGPIPDISSMNGLMYLYANQSGFSGQSPFKQLSNMSNLVVLSVGDNLFDKSKFPMEVLKLTKLNWLYMANCSIEGEIPPGIGNLTELINLELSSNHLYGEIPREISKLSKLWQLELYSNGLTGKLPVGLRNLTNLRNLDASSNSLEGDLSEIRFLNGLVTLQLFENKFSGVVPPELGEFKQLVNLSLYTNNLTGTLPQSLGSFSDFNFIDVSENFLTGTIPPDMCKNGKMLELLVLQNRLTGEIPASYANCQTLTRFRVSKNLLSGVVPGGIWGLPAVDIIDIESNDLEGSITPDIGNAASLAQIFAANNRLSGELPDEISGASNLNLIDLSHNQISGRIPATIGKLSQLSSLHLDNNMLSGEIPDSLQSCKSLSDLSMAGNSLSGHIPAGLGLLPTLYSLNLSTNQLQGEIPVSLSSQRLSLLDLSHNKLSGPIPDSLSIDAYNGSFAGNNELCSQKVKYFRRCAHDSGVSPEIRTLIAVFSVGSIAIFCLLACFFYIKKNQKDGGDRSLREDSWDVKSFHALTFSEGDILDSIKQDNVIGKGGSGNVYRVSLKNGVELAVKHIWNTDSGGRKMSRSSTPMLGKRSKNTLRSSEFEAEVDTLSSIRHINVVKLYCSISSEDSSLLVYEYLPNGSLWDRLHTCKKLALDWDTRYEIAVGAAKGLEYLHHGCERPVIHRDVKSSNILLDEFLKPRIADFGLAKIVEANSSKDSTQVVAGTHGYIAPEYGYTCKVDEKSDVYSFGVVLMELVTGKRPIEPEFGENKDIVNWVSGMLKNKESVLSLVDSSIAEHYKEDTIKVLKIAILCTSRLPTLRPTMRSVTQMLEEAEPCKLVGIIISDAKKLERKGSGKV